MKIKSEALNSNHETNTNFLNLKSKTCGERRRTILNLKSQIVILLFVFCCLLFVGSCRDKPTPPDDGNHYIPSITLTAEDVGVTDAWLKVKFLDTTVNRKFKLVRDGETILTTPCSSLDTVILDENLLPKHTYRYIALRLVDTVVVDSALLTVPTMDTTSHNFTWKIDTLGDGNSSVLRDVCIINDTCVWVVGEIYKKDSTGQFGPLYNAIRWNGNKWNKIRVTVRLDYGTSVIYTDQDPITSIFTPGQDDIWFVSSAGGVTRYKNNSWVMMNIPYGEGPGGANKVWGTSSSNMYFVANNGRFTHYNGTSWQKIESGTTTSLLDVWGSPDGSVVWACGWEDFKPTVLLRLQNGQWEKAWEENHPFTQRDDTLSGAFTSVWLPNNRQLFALSWYGLYRCPTTTNGEGNRIPLPPTWSGFLFRLRGNDANDLFIVGEYYMVAHYNGMTFRHYQELQGYGGLRSVAQKGNLVVAVGFSFDPIHSLGIVYIGRK